MVKTLAMSLVCVLTIGSIGAAGAAPRGLQRGGLHGPVPGPVLKKSFDALRGSRGHGRFFGFGVPLVDASYDDPNVYFGVNHPPVAPNKSETPFHRVCRAAIYNVPAESGGRRDVRVIRCFVE